jgi:hypothetical protein
MVDMFTTCGGNGLGTLTVEQLPSRLAGEVVKLIVNVISHAVGDEADRRIVGSHIGVEEGRIDHLQQMRVGETVIYLEGENVAKNVRIWPIDKLLECELPEAPVSAEQVRGHMEAVFESHENLRSVVELPSNIIALVERSGPVSWGLPSGALPVRGFESAMGHSFRESRDDYEGMIREFVSDPDYLDGLEAHSASLRRGDIEPLVDMVVETSEDLAGSTLDRFWMAERLAVHSGNVRPDLLDRVAVDSVLARLKERRKEG